MKKYKRKTVEDLYRMAGEYWNTSDTDYLKIAIKLSQDIDNRLWCEVESLAYFAVRRNAGINTLIRALTLFGYEVQQEEIR